jgi:hypothetical protein
MIAPKSRMNVLTPEEIERINTRSELVDIYSREMDKETAYEILMKKMEYEVPEPVQSGRQTKEASMFETIMTSTAGRQVQRTLINQLIYILLDALGLRRSRSRSTSTRRRR